MKFEIRSGDGNFGCTHDRYVEAENMDEACEIAASLFCLTKTKLPYSYLHEETGVCVEEDGDDHITYFTAMYGPDGETAYNGGAWWYAEVIDTELT